MMENLSLHDSQPIHSILQDKANLYKPINNEPNITPHSFNLVDLLPMPHQSSHQYPQLEVLAYLLKDSKLDAVVKVNVFFFL